MNLKKFGEEITKRGLWDKSVRGMSTSDANELATAVIEAMAVAAHNAAQLTNERCFAGPCPACFAMPAKAGDVDYRQIRCGIAGVGIGHLDECPAGKWYFCGGSDGYVS